MKIDPRNDVHEPLWVSKEKYKRFFANLWTLTCYSAMVVNSIFIAIVFWSILFDGQAVITEPREFILYLEVLLSTIFVFWSFYFFKKQIDRKLMLIKWKETLMQEEYLKARRSSTR